MFHLYGLLFLLYLLPATPDDAICFIAGLSRIRFRVFMVVVILGRLPGFIILSMLGDGIAHHGPGHIAPDAGDHGHDGKRG